MEKLTDYTCNPEYVQQWNKLMARQSEFVEMLSYHSKGNKISMEEFGEVEIGHLRSRAGAVEEAFDVMMRVEAYWKIVLRRMVDCMALHMLFSIQNLVNREMEAEIINEIVGGEGRGLEKMLEESPAVAEKRKRLNNSMKLLKESKDVVANIMDQVSVHSLGN